MTDIFSNHGLPQAIRPKQHQIAPFREEVQSERALDDVAFDLGGPVPLEVGHWLELLDAGEAQAPFQAAPRVLVDFGLRQVFQHLARRPAGLDGPRQEVVEVGGQRAQSDLFELVSQIIHRIPPRAGGRVHRRTPDPAAAPRWIALADDGLNPPAWTPMPRGSAGAARKRRRRRAAYCVRAPRGWRDAKQVRRTDPRA